MKTRLRWNSENGVVIPLLAVIGLGVIALLVILGVNASRVKYASLDLRTEANDICSALADQSLINQRAVAEQFAKKVHDYALRLPSGIELESATVIAPTMSTLYDMPTSFQVIGGHTVHYDSSPPDSRPEICGQAKDICGTPNNCAGNPAFNFTANPDVCGSTFCGGGSRCFFQGDVLPTITENPPPPVPPFPSSTVTLQDKYPLTLAHNLSNAGNTVFCEFRARVSGMWFGTEEQGISVRVGFWQPAVGIPNYNPADYAVIGEPEFDTSITPARIPFPGLTVALATQMTTNYSDQRFRFPVGLAPFDPNSGAPITFTGPSRDYDYPPPPGSKDVASVPSPANLLEARTACMNPAILVRNAYLAALMELASRHAHFRMATEILHINPQFRYTDPADYAKVPVYSNLPSLIAPFFTDIADPVAGNLQLPFVFYHGGTTIIDEAGTEDIWDQPFRNLQVTPAEFGVVAGEGDRFADGFLQPIVPPNPNTPFGFSDSGLTAATASFHAMLAGQLRNCYHLYGSNPGLGLIKRYDDFPITNNQGFEPSSVYFIDDNLTKTFYNPVINPWSQGDAWLFGGDPAYSSFWRPLNAAEIMASLGSTQSCPFPMSNGLQSGAADCVKPVAHTNPDMGSYDLRPDIAAALAYIGGLPINVMPEIPGRQGFPAQPAVSTVAPARAISRPGLFRLTGDDDQPVGDPLRKWVGLNTPSFGSYFPFDPTTTQYTLPKVTSSSIVLVLHQRIGNPGHSVTCGSEPDFPIAGCTCSAGAIPVPAASDPENEVCRIRCAVDQLLTQNPVTGQPAQRPITVLYFPTNDIDANTDPSGNVFKNLSCAFKAVINAGDATTGNIIVPFTRFDINFLGETFGGGDCGLGESLCWQSYWNYLLTSPSGSNIIDQAKLLFQNRLTAKAIKF